jgi:L,D-peptidoglycan transpeptidase YkuD (ErfK/YbiS/YcfS/YnhG family)
MTNDIYVYTDGRFAFQNQNYRCAIGRSGIIAAADKREGDGATPIGSYPIREIWYRADRVTLPTVNFPVHEIKKTDGWCDAADHPQYNQHVVLPFTASHENLWREDHRYDVVVVLGHNDDPVIPYMGSCIFFHIAEKNYQPTAGCVAVSLEDMIKILPQLKIETKIHFQQ